MAPDSPAQLLEFRTRQGLIQSRRHPSCPSFHTLADGFSIDNDGKHDGSSKRKANTSRTIILVVFR